MKDYIKNIKVFFVFFLFYNFPQFFSNIINKPKINLIPAIDIIDGHCVRLSKGDYGSKTVYSKSPVEMAKYFESLGYKRLHIVDLDGAKSRHVVNIDILKSIKTQTNLIVDFGGGIKTVEDLKKVFESGANMVTIGSIAVTSPTLLESWIKKYGPDKIILGADVKNGNISINGWLENSQLDLFSFIDKYYQIGIRTILCTDISRDGMLSGPSVELYTSIMKKYPDINLIASGGVANIKDIKILNDHGIPSVVFGKSIYEGHINLKDLINWKNGNI